MLNLPSSPRLYAIISSAVRNPSTEPSLCNSDSVRTATPTMYDPTLSHFPQQLSPILQNLADPSQWQSETLPPPVSVGQTPSPENNHWLNIGDRFIFLGGDNENFRAFIVEASHRAAIVPFEAKVTHQAPGASTATDYWFPYVEAARVFVNPGKLWYRILSAFESMAQARELGVPKRKWLFLDGRDQPTRETPTELASRRTMAFVRKLLGIAPSDADVGDWGATWEMMHGTAGSMGVRGGWNWKSDLKYGFIWPPDVGSHL